MTCVPRHRWLLIALLLAAMPAAAREAAFVEPGTVTSKGTTAEALVADPKQIEAGESTVGVLRRVSLFFANTGGVPVTISEITATGDGNVTVQREDSDCKASGKIPSFSRCSVALSITPTSAGAWTVEILATHDGPGRIARAVVTGRAINDSKTAARAEGLNLSSRDMKPMDFGDVDIGTPAVRTALMVNDSPEPLTIKSIELIAVDQGLELLPQGCAVDLELKTDESCPITMKWTPHNKGNVATDLIMRHSGKIGFTVIPVRGRGVGEAQQASTQPVPLTAPASLMQGEMPPPPTAEEIMGTTANLPPVVLADDVIERPASAKQRSSDAKLYLIGAVGRRAILQREGVTKSVAVGSEVEIAGATVQLLALADREARVLINGQHRSISLGPSGFRPPPSVKNGKDVLSKSFGTSSNSQSSSGK